MLLWVDFVLNQQILTRLHFCNKLAIVREGWLNLQVLDLLHLHRFRNGGSFWFIDVVETYKGTDFQLILLDLLIFLVGFYLGRDRRLTLQDLVNHRVKLVQKHRTLIIELDIKLGVGADHQLAHLRLLLWCLDQSNVSPWAQVCFNVAVSWARIRITHEFVIILAAYNHGNHSIIVFWIQVSEILIVWLRQHQVHMVIVVGDRELDQSYGLWHESHLLRVIIIVFMQVIHVHRIKLLTEVSDVHPKYPIIFIFHFQLLPELRRPVVRLIAPRSLPFILSPWVSELDQLLRTHVSRHFLHVCKKKK